MADDLDRRWTYAECPTTSAAIEITARAEDAWLLISDITLPVRFSNEVRQVEWLDGATGSLGATFRGHNVHPVVGEWETTCTVTAFEPGRRFAWCVGEPEEPSAVWAFEIEPSERGIRLRQHVQLGPAPSGLTPAIQAMPDKEAKIISRRLAEHRANMEANLAGIKSLLETESQ